MWVAVPDQSRSLIEVEGKAENNVVYITQRRDMCGFPHAGHELRAKRICSRKHGSVLSTSQEHGGYMGQLQKGARDKTQLLCAIANGTCKVFKSEMEEVEITRIAHIVICSFPRLGGDRAFESHQDITAVLFEVHHQVCRGDASHKKQQGGESHGAGTTSGHHHS